MLFSQILMNSVNRLDIALVGGGKLRGIHSSALCSCLRVRILLLAIFFSIQQHNDHSVYNVHIKLLQDSNFKATFAKKVAMSGCFNENIKFTYKFITVFLICILWTYLLILLSGDVHQNPGPNSFF